MECGVVLIRDMEKICFPTEHKINEEVMGTIGKERVPIRPTRARSYVTYANMMRGFGFRRFGTGAYGE